MNHAPLTPLSLNPTSLYEKDLEYLNQCIQEKPKDIDVSLFSIAS